MIEKIDLARRLAKEKKYREAEEVLKPLLESEEDRALIHYELGKVYFDWEKYDVAIEELKQSTSLEITFLQAYLILGLCYEKKSQYYSAEECYLRAIELDPYFWASYTQLASLYREQNDMIRAQKTLEKALENECSEALLHLNLGSVYAARGLLEKAIEQLEIARKLSPSGREILTSLGEVYIAKREYDKALEVFGEQEKLYPNDSYVYQNIGSVYHTMLNFIEAEKYYTIASLSPPPNEACYYLLSLIRARVYEDYQKAIELSEKANEINFDFVSGYFANIEYHYHLGLLDRMKEKFENFLITHPNKALFKLCLGTCFLHEEKFEEARKLFHSAIEIHREGFPFPYIYAVYFSLANTYDYLEMTLKAIEYIKIPLLEEPYCPELYFSLGLLQRKADLMEQARNSFERVAQLIPFSVIAYCARAYNSLAEGKPEEAMIDAREAEKFSYKSDKVHYLLGLLEEKVGNMAKSIEYYEKAVEYNHLHMEARKALFRLKNE